MSESDRAANHGRSTVRAQVWQPAPVAEEPLTPADLRRSDEESPSAWLERLQRLSSADLPLHLRITRNKYISRAEELIRETQEANSLALPPSYYTNGSLGDNEDPDSPPPSALDRLKDAYLALDAADRQAFVLWMATRTL